jgi:nicotinamidase/pyrazinamidase
MNSCLIVVDYQNDFVTGSLGFPKAAALEDYLVAQLDWALARDWDIYLTQDTHEEEDYAQTQEGRRLPIGHCFAGSWGHALYGKVGAWAVEHEGDYTLVEKPQFGSTRLAHLLSAGGYDEIRLMGVVTNICVLSNAVLIKAMLPETRITIDAAGCASNDDRLHEETLDVLAGLQMDVLNREG